MRLRRLTAAAGAAALALTIAACGGGDGGGTTADVAENAKFKKGTQMAALAKSGQITIGVKFDQPGIGFLKPGDDKPSGFDIKMGEYIAGKLGIAPEDINWKETVSDNREPFLQNRTVDIVLASYSITPDRAKLVGFAGPYYVTGQQLLVREEDKNKITGPKDLDGVKVCSVTGSTSLENVVQDYGANPVPFDTYSACVRQLEAGTVDAVTTDGAILLGYAAQQPDKFEVVGPEFSEERYGIGHNKQETEMCQFLTNAIKQSYKDGYWAKAFKATLGKSGIETPKPPEPDSCKS